MARGVFFPLLKPNELLLLFVTAALVVHVRFRVTRLLRWGIIDQAFLIILATTIILPLFALALRGEAFGVSDLFAIFAPVRSYLWYLVIVNSIKTKQEIKITVAVFVAVSCMTAVIAFVQATNFARFEATLGALYPDVHAQLAASALRVTSTLGGWNDFGSYMMMTLLVLFVLWLEKAILPRIWLVAAAAICAAGLFLSGNFSSILALALGMGCTLLLVRRLGNVKVWVIILGAVAAAGDGAVVYSTHQQHFPRTAYAPIS